MTTRPSQCAQSAVAAAGTRPGATHTGCHQNTVPAATQVANATPLGKSTPRIIDSLGVLELDDLSLLHSPSTIVGTDSETQGLRQPLVAAPQVGQRVGRYLTEEILGQGGMGIVLRARDDLLQRNVAIKVMLPEYLSSDATAGLRFLREAEIVARLNHPHVIRVLDAGLDSGIAYLAFDYIEGVTLNQLCKQRELIPAQSVDLLLPVVSAVASAHRRGVVHGDLKPTNILVGRDHLDGEHPWVLDFGVSFFSDHLSAYDPIRRRVTGTPGYLAPEWLQGKGVDHRADCFSLGCVMYETLAKRQPYAGVARLSEAVSRAMQQDYPRLAEIGAASAGLSQVVDGALHPDPSKRIGSAALLGKALLPHASPLLRLRYEREFELPGC